MRYGGRGGEESGIAFRTAKGKCVGISEGCEGAKPQ